MPAGKAATPLASTDGALFKAQLGGSLLHALFLGKSTAVTTTSTAGAPALTLDAALVQRVRDQLDRGIPLNDIISRLAGSLATSVAAQLGVPVDDAKQRLTQAFTQALSSPAGTGPPGSNAERASSLVARFRQIAELATRVTNGDPGQPIRQIAGTSLDANSAKANPAPPPDRILRDALNALAAPASPFATSPAVASADPASAVVVPAATANPLATSTWADGRTVAVDPTEAIASGGDTPLGRILARSLIAGSQRTAPAVATNVGVPSASRTAPNPGATSATPVTPGPLGGSTGASAASIVDAFAQAFASAVARNDGNESRANPDGTAAAAPPTNPAQPIASPPTPQPFGIGNASNAIVSVSPPPAPVHAVPHQPVDANAVVDQLLRGISLRTDDGSSTVRLRLFPENLGDVSVKLVVNGGSVDASITAHSVDAQSALAGGQAQLARTLADAGLKLASFNVGLAGGTFGDARDQTREHSWQRPGSRRIGGIESGVADEGDDPSLLAAPMFGPPIYTAHPNQWGLDYLV